MLWLVTWSGSVLSAAGFTDEAYVWQRQFGPEVIAAMRQFSPSLQGYCVLAAEVSWTQAQMTIARVALDYAALRQIGTPVGLAVRVGSSAGAFGADDPDEKKLLKLVADLLGESRSHGLEPRELQIDFDCPESKLSRYREGLRALRSAVGPTKLVFTALPAWLKHEEFSDLARSADGFILQVHSLEKPANFAQDVALCDPVRALAWIRQAEKVGVPFRVALPTHGYVMGFGPSGNYLGVGAEGPRPVWPKETRTRLVRADPVSLVQLVRTLGREPLTSCTGVIWFRLPVPNDRLAWSAPTFAAVLRHENPVVRLAAEVSWPEPGLAEITLVNSGETTEPLPAGLSLRLPAAEKILTGDGLGGFRLEVREGEVQGIARATHVPADAMIAPGRRMKIAWLRFAHDVSLAVSFAPPP